MYEPGITNHYLFHSILSYALKLHAHGFYCVGGMIYQLFNLQPCTLIFMRFAGIL